MSMIEQARDLWLWADWPAPKHVRAGTSLRTNGISHKPYGSLNLAQHVGDKFENVLDNRKTISKSLTLPSEPAWLKQVHGKNIISLDTSQTDISADGSYTSNKNKICTILTADCVPVLFCNSNGTKIAAIHAGWKGICAGIIERVVNEFSDPKSLLAWIGPCISSEYYEVGKDVYDRCLNHSDSLKGAFSQVNPNHWQCNLTQIVKIILNNSGVGLIHECGLCTYKTEKLFYSYRRDGKTGRTASMIWME